MKGIERIREGLWLQREGMVKQEEGLAEVQAIVAETPIRSLGARLESLAPPTLDKPSSASLGKPGHITDVPVASALDPALQIS